jgi:hypothetical protein
MRLKTLLLTLCVAGTATFAQKVKYSKEEKKEMNRYFLMKGSIVQQTKSFHHYFKGQYRTSRL